MRSEITSEHEHEHHEHEHREHHHDHEHHHEHEHHHHEHSLKRQLGLIIATVILLAVAVFIEHVSNSYSSSSSASGVFSFLLPPSSFLENIFPLSPFSLLLIYLVPYLLIGHETLHEAWEGITHGDAFNEHFLMSVATIGALLIGFLPGAETEFPEAVFVMLFFQVGELFEGYAEGQSRKSIAHLMDIRPDVAHVEVSRSEDISRKEECSSRSEECGVRSENTLSAESALESASEHISLHTPHSSLLEKIQTKDLPPSSVAVNSIIVVKPGEKIPLDGVVIEGTSALNTVALTGESLPRGVDVGDEVISGCVNLSGVLRVRVTKPYGESTVSKIIRLVEDAGEHKSQSETFITRFARIYTPIVVFAALALAIIPTLWNIFQCSMFNVQWIYRALMFLVVSCPCALVISVPLTFFGGIGGASRKGILVKGANFMDVLAKVDTVVFDKTGTLTHGQFAVEAVHSNSRNEECFSRSEECGVRSESTPSAESASESSSESASALVSESASKSASEHISLHTPHSSLLEKSLLEKSLLEDYSLEKNLLHLAAHVEHFSTHPIGAALRDAFPDEATDGCTVSDVEEIAGHGIRARVKMLNGQSSMVNVGNTKMMDAVGAEWHDCAQCHDEHRTGTVIHVAIDGAYAGHIVINDQIKPDSAEAITSLKALGVRKTVMLTGDRREVAEHVAQTLGIDEYHAELLPEEKVEFFSRNEEGGNKTAFVGDGINDAPVLARADVGIAMGGLGSDAAIEAADVVLMDDKPSKIALAIRIARRTLAIARQNVAFAIGVKVAVLVLAAIGIATMWLAVFADVGVTVLAVLNAMRALRVK